MDFFHSLLDLVAHLDQHLLDGLAAYGVWAYAALFLVICCESTLTPFLPGDSLLFAAGALATNALLSSLPVVRDHFAFVVFGVFLVSLVPLLVEWLRTRSRTGEAAHG